MPFQETRVMDERRRFLKDTHRSLLSFAELCRRYGISRNTGYKWLKPLGECRPTGTRRSLQPTAPLPLGNTPSRH
jgi:putative transposase